MKVPSISDNITSKLNTAISHERTNESIYLCMAVPFSRWNLNGFYGLFMNQANGESEHTRRVIKYLDERNANYQVTTAAYPHKEYKALSEMMDAFIEVEQGTTQLYNELYMEAMKESDVMTMMFAQKIIEEQKEEENLAMYIQSRFKILGLETLDINSLTIDDIDATLRNSLIEMDKELLKRG